MSIDAILRKTTKVQSGIKSVVARVGLAFADAVLKDCNDSNRPMSGSVAKLYANEMLRGQWECNGEPLIFSIDHQNKTHLISGQHRLRALQIACKEAASGDWPNAQTEIDMVIVTGVDHATADTVDTGKTRSHADVLFRDPWVDKMIPEEWNKTAADRRLWTKTLAGAARLVWLVEGGAVVSSAPKFVITEMLTFLQHRHEGLCQFVTMVLNAADADGGNKGLKMSHAYMAALAYVACISEDEDGISVADDAANMFDTWFHRISVGSSLVKGEAEWAITAYWNKLQSDPGSKDRDRDWVGPFVKAARAMLIGQTGLKVSDIALTKKERDNYNDFPIMFEGWQTTCFERAAAIKAARLEAKNAPKGDIPVVANEPEPAPPVPQKPAKRKAAKAKPKAAVVPDIPEDDGDWSPDGDEEIV